MLDVCQRDPGDCLTLECDREWGNRVWMRAVGGYLFSYFPMDNSVADLLVLYMREQKLCAHYCQFSFTKNNIKRHAIFM